MRRASNAPSNVSIGTAYENDLSLRSNLTGMSVGRRSRSSKIPSVLDGSLFLPPGDVVVVPPATITTTASLPKSLETTYLSSTSLERTAFVPKSFETTTYLHPTTATNNTEPTLLRRMSTQTHYLSATSSRPAPPHTLTSQRSRTSLNTPSHPPPTTLASTSLESRHLRRTSYSHAEAALRNDNKPVVEVTRCGRFTLTREYSGGCVGAGMGHRRRDSGSRFVVVRDEGIKKEEGKVAVESGKEVEKKDGDGEVKKRGRFVVGRDGGEVKSSGEVVMVDGEEEGDKNGTMNTVRSADSGVVV
ncbi:hypothetical protein HK097_001698 [Rhizophlyctis rosea]|uniref:Uncharacterized protein n=1 Tax=Rhizophlyctis rosea TaxID=64517 RepID=A0AAD5S451_9FUNG|nr:hypothetical protein HK097_001698 [Rhizophlyctis rosea]